MLRGCCRALFHLRFLEREISPAAGRGNGLSKYLLLVLIAFKIKLALFWIALAAVAIKSFLAGLVLAKNVAVFVHEDRRQPFLYHTPSYRFVYLNVHPGHHSSLISLRLSRFEGA